jgi:hypothetical protein
MDLMADELNYRDYGRFLLAKAVTGPMKVLLGR